MEIYELAITRRSIRRFQDRPVPPAILQKCVDAARLVPSAANVQPLEYIVVDDSKILPEVFSTLKWAAYISPDGDPPEGKQPTAYIVILKRKDMGKPSSVYDVGAAMESMILVALGKGIGSCALASVDREKLSETLGVPDNYEIPLVLALGYPDETPVVEPLKESVKYWKDGQGVLHVPKRKLEDILHTNSF